MNCLLALATWFAKRECKKVDVKKLKKENVAMMRVNVDGEWMNIMSNESNLVFQFIINMIHDTMCLQSVLMSKLATK